MFTETARVSCDLQAATQLTQASVVTDLTDERLSRWIIRCH